MATMSLSQFDRWARDHVRAAVTPIDLSQIEAKPIKTKYKLDSIKLTCTIDEKLKMRILSVGRDIQIAGPGGSDFEKAKSQIETDRITLIPPEKYNTKAIAYNANKDILKNIPTIRVTLADIKFISIYVSRKAKLKSFAKDLKRLSIVTPVGPTETFIIKGQKITRSNTLYVQKIDKKRFKLAYYSGFIAQAIIEDYIYRYSGVPGYDNHGGAPATFAYLIGHELLHYRYNHFGSKVSKGILRQLGMTAHGEWKVPAKNKKALDSLLMSEKTKFEESMNNSLMSEILGVPTTNGGVGKVPIPGDTSSQYMFSGYIELGGDYQAKIQQNFFEYGKNYDMYVTISNTKMKDVERAGNNRFYFIGPLPSWNDIRRIMVKFALSSKELPDIPKPKPKKRGFHSGDLVKIAPTGEMGVVMHTDGEPGKQKVTITTHKPLVDIVTSALKGEDIQGLTMGGSSQKPMGFENAVKRMDSTTLPPDEVKEVDDFDLILMTPKPEDGPPPPPPDPEDPVEIPPPTESIEEPDEPPPPGEGGEPGEGDGEGEEGERGDPGEEPITGGDSGEPGERGADEEPGEPSDDGEEPGEGDPGEKEPEEGPSEPQEGPDGDKEGSEGEPGEDGDGEPGEGGDDGKSGDGEDGEPKDDGEDGDEGDPSDDGKGEGPVETPTGRPYRSGDLVIVDRTGGRGVVMNAIEMTDGSQSLTIDTSPDAVSDAEDRVRGKE